MNPSTQILYNIKDSEDNYPHGEVKYNEIYRHDCDYDCDDDGDKP